MRSWYIVLLCITIQVGFVIAGDEPPEDAKALQGNWTVIYAKMGKREASAENLKKLTVQFEGDTVTIAEAKSTYVLDARQTPKHMDMKAPDGVFRGIYQLDGKKLTLCWYKRDKDVPRPTKFSREDSEYHIVYLEMTKENMAIPQKP